MKNRWLITPYLGYLRFVLVAALLFSANSSIAGRDYWRISYATVPSYGLTQEETCQNLKNPPGEEPQYSHITQYQGDWRCYWTSPPANNGNPLFLGKIWPIQCNWAESWDSGSESCKQCSIKEIVSNGGECLDGGRNLGNQCDMTSNPVNIGTGNKFYHRTDYQGEGVFPLAIERFYNSIEGSWLWRYQQNIVVSASSPRIADVTRPDGQRFQFTESGSDWVSDSNVRLELTEDVNGFELVTENDVIEKYDTQGQLLSITNRAGLVQTLAYNTDQFSVTGVSNDTLTFYLDTQGRIEKVSRPNNQDYRYLYDASGLLTDNSYPDDTPSQSGSNPFGEDNPYESLHYEDVNFAHYVTGITDEKGIRISTVQYDIDGRAIASELANGAERTTFDYTHINDETDPRVTITNVLGKDTTYHFSTVHGVRKVTQVEGHASTNCAAANKNITYDANGFKDEVTDWEGNVTDYDYDARGLEIQRIEAKGEPEEHTIVTEWHVDFRLPTKITESDRVIEFTYDTSGQLLERKETPLSP